MNATITIIRNQPHILNGMVLSLLVGLVFSYIYLLSLTVVHVVMRQEADRDIVSVQSQINVLEADYMAAQHHISNEIAKRTDLHATDEKIFISRSSRSLVLSSVDGS